MALLKTPDGVGANWHFCVQDLLNGNDFPYVALVGMPGIGKTTIANAVLKAKSTQSFRQVHMTVGLPSEEAKRQQLVNVWKGQKLAGYQNRCSRAALTLLQRGERWRKR